MNDFLDWTFIERVAPALVSAMGLAWWLSGKFRNVETRTDDRVQRLADQQKSAMDAHEIKDQLRHDQNLLRFEKISVSLARLGSDNGTVYGQKEHSA